MYGCPDCERSTSRNCGKHSYRIIQPTVVYPSVNVKVSQTDVERLANRLLAAEQANEQLQAGVERLRTAIEDALGVAVMEGRPMHMEPWGSLTEALESLDNAKAS